MPKPIKQVKNQREYNPGSGATNARNLLENAFREKNNSERKQQQLRSSFKEDVLNDKPGTRTNIVPGDLNMRKGPAKEQNQVTRQRNWERWRETGERERTPAGPAIDRESAYRLMQKNKKKR